MVNVMKLLDKDIEGENIRLFYNDHPSLDERNQVLSGYLGARADKVTPADGAASRAGAYFRNVGIGNAARLSARDQCGRCSFSHLPRAAPGDFIEDSKICFG
jgi:hypothetical protein